MSNPRLSTLTPNAQRCSENAKADCAPGFSIVPCGCNGAAFVTLYRTHGWCRHTERHGGDAQEFRRKLFLQRTPDHGAVPGRAESVTRELPQLSVRNL